LLGEKLNERISGDIFRIGDTRSFLFYFLASVFLVKSCHYSRSGDPWLGNSIIYQSHQSHRWVCLY